jgi:alcohol dehydrogenase class IV
MKTKIHFGTGAINALQEIKNQQVLIVCDPFMVSSHMIDDVTDILAKSGNRYQVFSEIVPDPTIDVVVLGIKVMAQVQPDVMIAFGGGSAIDAAKAICLISAKMTQTKTVPLIVIPTTSGTGSEVTSFSVITDTESDVKYPLIDAEMLPNEAILDPKLTHSVPENVTADTGIDVLTHCLEAYVSTQANDFSDACAEKAARLVWQYLTDVVSDGSDSIGREKLHNASCLAGIAFNSASLGLCHGMAHALGGKFHVPHGRSNAMLLPLIISFNAGVDLNQETPTLHRYVTMANLLGIQGTTPKAAVHQFIRQLKKKLAKMAIPASIEAYGLDSEAFKAAIPEMAEKARHDNCTLTNPRIATQEEIEALYLRLSRG